MESLKSIQFQGKTITFSFNTGALKTLRELGYEINYNDQENIIKNIKNIDCFYADVLFAGAKFYSRKDPSFDYDRDDAHDWIEPFGGLASVVSAFFQSLNAGVKIPEGVLIPNEKPVKKLSEGLKK